MPCYPGPNPIDKNDPDGLRRAAIWKWAKEHGIDQGKSFDEIHDMINQKVYSGAGKSEWITDILKGRKTPFQRVANDAWHAQAQRKAVIALAKDRAGRAAMTWPHRMISKVWETPRGAAVWGHGVVFPITHGGDMIFNPQRWGVLYRGIKNTWTKTGAFGINTKQAIIETEQTLNTMYKDPLFNMAINSGVDLSPKAHGSDLISAGKQSERAYAMLKVMRFELWKNEMAKFEAKNPEMSPLEKREMAKYLGTMANHATGSGQGMLTSSKVAGQLLFGAKLTQSKLNRMAEAAKTLGTYANWNGASPVQKVAARTHLTRMTQFALTYGGFLAANQGYLWATGQKDKDGKSTQINWKDPTKSDWMKFKVGGMEAAVPGIRSELHTLGKVLAIAFKDSKDVKKETHGGTKFDLALKSLAEYAVSKTAPTVQAAAEGLYGTETWGLHHPMPWSGDKGTAKSPRLDWWQYAISHGPIPLSGPIRYVYDQAKARGMDSLDATAWIKALIIAGVGATGVHITPDYNAPDLKREVAAHQLRH